MTAEEIEELADTDNCKWESTTLNGVKGYKVTSRKTGYTDMWIFLPAAGYRVDTDVYNAEDNGDYWSSSASAGSYRALGLYFSSIGGFGCNSTRINGFSIRAVSE